MYPQLTFDTNFLTCCLVLKRSVQVPGNMRFHLREKAQSRGFESRSIYIFYDMQFVKGSWEKKI